MYPLCPQFTTTQSVLYTASPFQPNIAASTSSHPFVAITRTGEKHLAKTTDSAGGIEQDVSGEAAEQVAEKLRDLYPDVEVEVLAGGQAIYQYIIGAE